MKIYVAQVNPTIGDLAGNFQIIQQEILKALQSMCDVVVFPELVTVGYPPRDLLYEQKLWINNDIVIDKIWTFIKSQKHQITAIVGGLHREIIPGSRYAQYNSAWILDRTYGKRVIHKRLLPCYDVFDETRYFKSAINDPYVPVPIRVDNNDINCDILICEDIWNFQFMIDDTLKPASYYGVDPVAHLQGTGPLFIINGSPFWIGKIKETRNLVKEICAEIRRPVVWCNQIGAHDDIITGGYSMIVLSGISGESTIVQAKAFAEDSLILDMKTNITGGSWDNSISTLGIGINLTYPDDFDMWSIYKALFLHMTDYKRRCGFKRAVLGLSGGIDSAVVAVIAAKVFGSENVTGITMPSPYSSESSIIDARTLADNLNIHFEVKPIKGTYEELKSLFLSGGKQKFSNPVTDENLQPRIRGTILMAHANEFGELLLTTGNKSEITVGYCTLYGDMCGGLAVISDLWKTQVYSLARFINKYWPGTIPENTISKPASAELRPNQKDTDSLLPYHKLDPLLKRFVEEGKDPTYNVEGISLNEQKMYELYCNSEFKRQQMPPGPKVQKRSFGSGRRMPIACKRTSV